MGNDEGINVNFRNSEGTVGNAFLHVHPRCGLSVLPLTPNQQTGYLLFDNQGRLAKIMRIRMTGSWGFEVRDEFVDLNTKPMRVAGDVPFISNEPYSNLLPTKGVKNMSELVAAVDKAYTSVAEVLGEIRDGRAIMHVLNPSRGVRSELGKRIIELPNEYKQGLAAVVLYEWPAMFGVDFRNPFVG